MNYKNYRLSLIFFIAFTVPIGFACKFYTGPLQFWVSNSLGGVLYEIFWCLFIALVWPKKRPRSIALLVLFVTSLLEVLQLWHPPFLEMIRHSFIGRTLIGTTFVLSDFVYYVIGCAFGFLVLHILQKKKPGC